MMGEGFVAGIAKVVSVGGLMAAAAGGIYALSVTTQDDGSNSQVVAESATPTEAGSPTAAATLETPSPESSETPIPSGTATSVPTSAPTLFPAPSGRMAVGGGVWVNARPASGLVEAWIGDTLCASATAASFPDAPPSFFMEIPSDDAMAGCGTDGATVEFKVDGQPANETAAFQEGVAQPITLTLGPPFQQISGRYMVIEDDLPLRLLVDPMIDGKVCGYDLAHSSGSTVQGYHVVVYSDQLEPGCGAPGRLVSLELVLVQDDGSNVPLNIILATVPWDASTVTRVAGEPTVQDLAY